MTYTTSKAQAAVGYGTVVSIGGVSGATGTETFTTLGEVNDFQFSTPTRKTVDVTNFQSLLYSEEFLGTSIDYGEVTFTCNRIPNDAGQLAVLAALSSPNKYDFKVQLPINVPAGQATTGDVITFSAVVTEAGGLDVGVDKVAMTHFKLKISGAITTVTGS